MHPRNLLRRTLLRFFSGALALLLLSNPLQAQTPRQKIVMSVFQKPEDSPTVSFLELIYREAFSRMNMDFSFKYVPAQRASIEADSGKTDGEPARREAHNIMYPHLIRVDESVMVITFAAYSTNSKIKLSGWQSLTGTNYRIDFYRGIPLVPERLRGLPEQNLLELTSHEQALQRLTSGRSDLYIYTEKDMSFLLKNRKDKKIPIYQVGILDRYTAYPFLHKKHKDLIPKLEAVLRAMKKDGTFKRFEDKIMGTSS